jgi:FKBP-type peptidyl-prolyl cis-trans isomerase FkpA
MVHFKAGDWVTNTDGSFTFSNGGKGIIFMPSGLAYGNVYQTKIPNNSPLIFYVNLNSDSQNRLGCRWNPIYV